MWLRPSGSFSCPARDTLTTSPSNPVDYVGGWDTMSIPCLSLVIYYASRAVSQDTRRNSAKYLRLIQLVIQQLRYSL
jgi:hypothetical protein